jgi:hypothetical protein
MHICVFALTSIFAVADAKSVRYDIAADVTTFPQKTPQATLESVLKAAEANRFDYLAAQLADPAFIDDRVQHLYGGRFADQVQDTRTRLDARTLVQLRRFLKEGEWQSTKDTATVYLKEFTGRTVSFELIGDRWFMRNRDK